LLHYLARVLERLAIAQIPAARLFPGPVEFRVGGRARAAARWRGARFLPGRISRVRTGRRGQGGAQAGEAELRAGGGRADGGRDRAPRDPTWSLSLGSSRTGSSRRSSAGRTRWPTRPRACATWRPGTHAARSSSPWP